MGKLKICIMTPEAKFLDSEADSVVFSLSDGGYEILPGHSPVALALASGFIRIRNDGVKRDIWSADGIAEIRNNNIEVFVDSCAFTEGELSFDEMRHFAKMQNEKQSVMEHEQSKLSIARTIAGLNKKKKNRNI